ncbi:MAG: PQQ-binding-like beta-propeller repeat protein [Kiritimatiellae bacterium]|nr:PQQ-binding-like beta-propeller repeat protein [Kiritimatiellia bacterium]
MKQRPTGMAWVTTVIAAAWLSAHGAYAAGNPAETAAEILDTAGITGGLIVHVGCGDGQLTAALRRNEAFIVHGLDSDAAAIEQARRRIHAQGLYGPVSVERWSGDRLPYAENLVNLLVAADLGTIPANEVLRVLAPNGVACVKRGAVWEKTVKPRPPQIDEWTHYLHDATGNPVARDSEIGPPRRLQWVGSPRWARHHEYMGSLSALVSTGGRIFYILDEGSAESAQLPAKWALIARDAFNGVVLWKRAVPRWHAHRWPLKSGPAQLTRRLVAVGERVYVTLGLDAPLSALDAATGQTVRTYEGSGGTEEVIASDGVLFLMANEKPRTFETYKPVHAYCWDEKARVAAEWPWDAKPRRVMAFEAESGRLLWQRESVVMPGTLAADGARLLFHDGERVVCLNRAGGEEQWRSEPIERQKKVPAYYAGNLIVHEDVVLFYGGRRVYTALSAETGKTLWTADHPPSGHSSPQDLMVVDGLVWAGAIAGGKHSGVFTGRDLHSGEVKKEFPPDVDTYWFHHRCHPSRGAGRYILTSRTGIEFVDVRAAHWQAHHWVRGGCLYGIMPCNGLIYAPPHPCACYLESKLTGFNVVAPGAQSEERAPEQDRLEKGPAYGEIANRQPVPRSPQGEVGSSIVNPRDWPTYRHDAARSGCTTAPVPAVLKRAWQADLGGRLSSVVVAGGKLFMASIDTHTVHALDAANGTECWRYTAGGRVDSPPTVEQGRVLFGSADGWLYCLRAADGALIWRFRAAPAVRRVMAFEQLESAWPVHGSVLVQDGAAYCVAGRSMFLDGGMRLCRLDPATGRLLSETVLDERDPQTGKNLQAKVTELTMPVALPDVLASDGRRVYMRSASFDLAGNPLELGPRDAKDQAGADAHLFCGAGFLDDAWFHRVYWMYGKSLESGARGWYVAFQYVPSGRLLVVDADSVYGYGRRPEYRCWSPVHEYQLFAAHKETEPETIERVDLAAERINTQYAKAEVPKGEWLGAPPPKKRGGTAAYRDFRVRKLFPLSDLSGIRFKWADTVPLHVRALTLAGATLFLAGPPDVADEEKAFADPLDAQVQAKLQEQAAALEGRSGAALWAVSASDGQRLAAQELEAPPVWDGMAAADGRLYLALKSGRVVCFAE